MRSFVLLLLSLAPLLCSIMTGIHAMPTPEDSEDFTDCGSLSEGLHARAPGRAGVMSATLEKAIEYLKTKAALTDTPIYWVGRNNGKAALPAAKQLMLKKEIVGAKAFTALELIEEIKKHYGPTFTTTGWKKFPDWQEFCETYTERVKPDTKKAFLVYGPQYKINNIIWPYEWAKLLANGNVEYVEAWEIGADGSLPPNGIEIKASKIGSPVKE
ncbi:hypothetical protein BDP27DRAFT_1321035 [Rhodocollybia butyracea]|uniref:Uncharacterized protein n=1 Tax=Rhodocollybia butyracea TaxID=206335 RepID=A0A9P5U9K8_9AGAR|nr:hypothetical protein BDP27DRAFT_1321035 [Rhodocollybia butyracea]